MDGYSSRTVVASAAAAYCATLPSLNPHGRVEEALGTAFPEGFLQR